jgi:RNA 3'-terminal phosphate cyclase (ATP)
MEQVAEGPCEAFMAWWRSGAVCDEHLADQLALPMSLAQGASCWTTSVVTEHLRTVLWVAGQFLPVESSIEQREDGTGLVTLRRVA